MQIPEYTAKFKLVVEPIIPLNATLSETSVAVNLNHTSSSGVPTQVVPSGCAEAVAPTKLPGTV